MTSSVYKCASKLLHFIEYIKTNVFRYKLSLKNHTCVLRVINVTLLHLKAVKVGFFETARFFVIVNSKKMAAKGRKIQ